MSVSLAVAGALGRMGNAIEAAVREYENIEIVARFDRPGATGADIVERDAALGCAEVVVDFTTPAASTALVQICAARGGPALVVGSTGFSADQEAVFQAASQRIAMVRSGNFSLGVNVLLGLVRQAAQILPPESWDIEILEAHHARKLDSPSGTALMLGRAAAAGRGSTFDPRRASERQGPRPRGAIGLAVLRGGGVIGEHSVMFAAEDEILTLAHSARDRSLFARGALRAAAWVIGRPPGLYDMQQVLGFDASAG